MTDEVRVLFFGAGASRAAPALRPLFKDIRAAIALRLGVPPDLLARTAPEALLSRLQDAGVPSDEILGVALAGGQPNALHRIATDVLAAGGSVWTTNIEDLIERAA